jgi:hypothetical protein
MSKVNRQSRGVLLAAAWLLVLAIIFGCGGASNAPTATREATAKTTPPAAGKTADEPTVGKAADEPVATQQAAKGASDAVQEQTPTPTQKKEEAPASGGPLMAKAAYEIALPLMQTWQKDAALFELTSSTDVNVKDGTCSDWHVKFFSSSARQTNSVYIAQGKPQVMGALDMYEGESYTALDISTAAFDSDKVLQIAQEVGGEAYAGQGATASVKYVGQEMYGGAVWIVNYTGAGAPAVIAIDPQNGAVLANVK